jgi:hypothetical protein
MICRIVLDCADGNVFSVIGVEKDIVERQWKDWLINGGLQ